MRPSALCVVVTLYVCAGCSVTVTQVVSPSELDSAERGSFTADGRFFAIGTHPSGRSDSGAWIVEITRGSDGAYVSTNYLAGALEGTSDGTLSGSPAGGSCTFSGMKAQGTRIYAACVGVTPAWRAALLEIDTQARTVRAGTFTSCNAEPAAAPCDPTRLYPNGMAIDASGRIYVSNMLEHLQLANDVPSIEIEGTGSIRQIVVSADAPDARTLSFTHRAWFGTDIVTDGLAPNGIQIAGQVLYYAAGANINRVDIGADGNAGAASVHYAGAALSYIDDFAVLDGRMLLARTMPPGLVALDRAAAFGTASELGTRDMDWDAVPSSVSYQADVPAGNSVFPAGSAVVTSEFGGGLYVVAF
jgi:hypothetical protein